MPNLNNKASFEIAATYVGTVIGAGFASGQEMLQFFLVRGHWGVWGTLVAGCLLALFGTLVLVCCSRWHIECYQQLFTRIFGKKAGTIFELLVTLFILVCYCIMLSATAALFREHLQIRGEIGIALTTVFVLFPLIRGVSGVVWLNSILVPLMFAICLLVGGLALNYGLGQGIYLRPLAASSSHLASINSTILYASYNVLLSIVVLASLGNRVKQAGSAVGGVAGGLLLGVFAFIICGSMLVFYPEVLHYEVPMLYVAGQFGSTLMYLYALLLWFAILTTALSSAYGFSQRISVLTGIPYRLAAVATVLIALPLAQFKFSYLVANVYPFFGYAGMLFLALLLWRYRFDH